LQIGRGFFRALSVECQQLVISALVDVAVESQTTSAAAVSCLKQVFTLSLRKLLHLFVAAVGGLRRSSLQLGLRVGGHLALTDFHSEDPK